MDSDTDTEPIDRCCRCGEALDAIVDDAGENATDFAREYDAKNVLIDVHVRDPGFAEAYRHHDHAEVAQHMHQRAGSQQRLFSLSCYLYVFRDCCTLLEEEARLDFHTPQEEEARWDFHTL